ncbi:MAG TPA: hypothetical protein ENI87_09155 [bacterium]|nr:hypothetical protein [bacterium]
MRRLVLPRAVALLGAVALLAACSSVAVPIERFYRLRQPSPEADDPLRIGTLRVHDLQLGTALDSDRLLVQRGVRLEPRPLARWVAPLDRLVTDALVLGLSRARVCELVKSSLDPGAETWSLHGRIVDFVEEAEGDAAKASVTLELWLERDGRLEFQDEFRCVEPMAESSPEAAVAALSNALNHIVRDVVGRMRSLDLFAAERSRRVSAEVAEPPR